MMMKQKQECDKLSRSRDLTNKRFGKLIVLKKMEEKEAGYFLWLCVCDCGNEVFVNTKRLVRGTVSDCGCEKIRRLGPKAENLEGTRFGKLLVLSRVENNFSGRVCWLCQCDCGNEKIVTSHELKTGTTRSCGCLRHNKPRTMKNLTGYSFNSITVLHSTEERDYKGSVMWMCRCVCGKKFMLSTDSIMHGNYKSCGCGRIKKGKSLQSYLTFVDGTCVEWIEKRKSRSDNTSGCTGVYVTSANRYRSQITLSGKKYYLGTYKTFEEAVKTRKHAEKVLHEYFVLAYREWEQKANDDPEWAKKNPFHFEVDKAKLYCQI